MPDHRGACLPLHTFMPCFDPCGQVGCRHRASDPITLGKIAAGEPHKIPVLLVLDTFGDNRHAELPGEPQAGVVHGSCCGFGPGAMNEALVYLEFVKRNVVQTCQR